MEVDVFHPGTFPAKYYTCSNYTAVPSGAALYFSNNKGAIQWNSSN